MKLMDENGHLTEELSAQITENRHLVLEKAALKRELTKMHGESPKAQDIRTVGEFWLQTHPRAKFPVAGKRWKVIEKALADHSTEELIEALEGLRLVPFVGAHGRCVQGTKGARRYDDVEHALRDEATIERFRGYARRARMSPEERLHVAYEVTGQVHDHYARLLLDRLAGVPSRRNGNEEQR